MNVADTELVARSRHADAEAFGVLVERHQRLVFGVALARCRDAALAEEVAQEAFVAAWRDLDHLRDAERVGPWVAGIARNLAANAARKRARQDAVPVEQLEQRAVPTPEDEALAREDRELVQRALAEVPEAHRETLVLYYMEGESVAAIADALGIREDLVKQRLSRGRRALRDSIAARVETALSRARTSPAFSAAVATAIAASAREATAATAGKAITMLATKKVALVGAATLAIVGGAVWLGRARAHDAGSSPETTTPPAAPGTPSASMPGAGSSTTAPKSKVRRLASPADRVPLLDAIRRARARRTPSAPSVSPAPVPTRLTPGSGSEVDVEYVKAAVMDLMPLLRECYEAGLERDKTIAGTVNLAFTIEGEPDVGGLVADSTILAEETTLVDPAVRECIQETMYGLEIDPPSNGGSVKVRNMFNFTYREE